MRRGKLAFERAIRKKIESDESDKNDAECNFELENKNKKHTPEDINSATTEPEDITKNKAGNREKTEEGGESLFGSLFDDEEVLKIKAIMKSGKTVTAAQYMRTHPTE
jgi:hypothetical protein